MKWEYCVLTWKYYTEIGPEDVRSWTLQIVHLEPDGAHVHNLVDEANSGDDWANKRYMAIAHLGIMGWEACQGYPLSAFGWRGDIGVDQGGIFFKRRKHDQSKT